MSSAYRVLVGMVIGYLRVHVFLCVVLESIRSQLLEEIRISFVFCSCVLLYNISRRNFNRLLLGLLRQQDRVDVRQDTASRDRDRTQQLGQFFIVSDGQLDVSRYDSGLLVVSGGVTGEFENFSR